jgi:hypothetical protein
MAWLPVSALLGAALRQRVFDRQRAAQAHHVGGAVAALDALPARVLGPILFEGGGLLFTGRLLHRGLLEGDGKRAIR